MEASSLLSCFTILRKKLNFDTLRVNLFYLLLVAFNSQKQLNYFLRRFFDYRTIIRRLSGKS